MNKATLLLMTFVLGLILTLHLSMNAAAGKIASHPRMSNALFWCIGAFVAVLLGLTQWRTEFFTQARQVPLWLWSAGGIGATLVFAIAWLIPQLGAASTMVVLLAGQVIGGLVITHYGWLGSPAEPINTVRLAGVTVMIMGAIVAVVGKIPFLK